MEIRRFLLVCMVFIVTFVCPALAWSSDDETSLRADLETGYEDDVRPEEVVNIDLALHITSLDSLDIKTQTMTISGWWFMGWDDPRLTWTAASYNNIDTLQYYQNDIWTPALVVSNSVDDLSAIDEGSIPMRVSNTGEITWNPPGILKFSCDTDITYFPFDRQICTIEVTSFGYTLQEVNVSSTGGLLFGFYGVNGDWNVEGSSATREEFTNHGKTFAKVIFSITLHRRNTFHWLNVLSPVILNGILICFVFLLPAESGGKIGYSLTCLLTYVVLLTLLAAYLPTSAKHVALLEVYLCLVLIVSGLSVVLTITNLHIYFTDEDKEFPEFYAKLTNWTMFIIRDPRYRAGLPDSKKVHPQSESLEAGMTKNGEKGNTGQANGIKSRSGAPTPVRKLSLMSQGQDKQSDVELNWKIMADVMDAFFLRLYAIVVTLMTLTFLIVMMTGQA